jgi:hypothetical protein
MVTSKLTSVVRIIYNSTRPPPSPAISISAFRISRSYSSFQLPPSSRKFLIANLELKLRVNPIRINELRFSNRKFLAILRSASRIPSPFEPQCSGFESLIENARLRSRLSPSRISQLEIPNRERMAISHLAPSPASLGLLSTRQRPLATAFLIVTPRLEFPATHTKQNSSSISNRYKPGFFHPAYICWNRLRPWLTALPFFTDHESPVTSHVANLSSYLSLITRHSLLPFSRNTLTCRALTA